MQWLVRNILFLEKVSVMNGEHFKEQEGHFQISEKTENEVWNSGNKAVVMQNKNYYLQRQMQKLFTA